MMWVVLRHAKHRCRMPEAEGRCQVLTFPTTEPKAEAVGKVDLTPDRSRRHYATQLGEDHDRTTTRVMVRGSFSVRLPIPQASLG
jgi:hypothetical protein